MGRQVRSDEIETVFEAWRARQTRPEACRLTDERRDLIRVRLALGYEVEDFVLLVRYAAESDEPGPRWWRGDNPTRKRYTDLANLLRREKLAGRVEAAREWLHRSVDRETENLAGRFRLVAPPPDEEPREPGWWDNENDGPPPRFASREQAPAREEPSAIDLFRSLPARRRGGVS